ncbi:MAG: thiamine diphosphokinase [Granulosicoccus sp.]|nr:thiamine diphosphokinase [Granulosicoccus sp.]
MQSYDHFCVFAGGDFSLSNFEQCVDRDNVDGYLAVDRGLEHCLAAGIVPTFLLGDFDSVSSMAINDARVSAVPRQAYPPDKDASDLELALLWLERCAPRKVTLVGISGGRTDHMLFNWQLPLLKDWPFEIDLVDSSVYASVVTPHRSLTIQARPGQQFSILAMNSCYGLNVSGAEYPLQNASLAYGSTRGLSNRVEGHTLDISLENGKCLVMLVNAHS